MKHLQFISVFFILFSQEIHSQSFLRLTYTHFGATKIYDIPNLEVLEYKIKGESKFRKDKIASMKDSSLLFVNYTEVRLDQIAALRLRTHNHLLGTFKTLFFMGGVGFITLNTVNNAITDTSPIFNEKAAYISGAMLVAGLALREMGIKRVRMTKNKNLKILNIDFQHMSGDSTSASK